ncbi:MAG: hypothetical protein ACI94Y_000853 [Maribacter sp.]|jgi:hypothetical protein
MKKIIWVFFITLLLTSNESLKAQGGFDCSFNAATGEWITSTGQPCVNTIITAVPFLRIIPDARSGAMGDAGIATSADANSMHFNTSKLPFADSEFGVSATYTPWLRSLGLTDVYMAYLTAYGKFGAKKDQAAGIGIRFFSLGQINFTNENGDPQGTGRPNEFELNGTYARKLSENFSVGVGAKFIYSNLAADQVVGGVEIKPGVTGAADISFTFNKEIKLGGMDARTTTGLAITNIGPKITYTNSINKDYIPTNLGIGTALELDFDEFNSITITTDFNKLMVPTPPFELVDEDPADGQPDYKQQGLIGAMFSSFGDAPGGFGEEMREFSISAGAEYWYDKQFAVRAGYYWEHATKGNRKYFTVGLGVKYSVFGLNFSYLVPTSNQRNPLDNTLRFTLLFDFGENASSNEF